MVKTNRGQALLLVLLAVSAILVVAMSVVSRSISDIQISTQEEESIRALNAAEAGLEETLAGSSIASIPETPINIAEKQANYETTVGFVGSSTHYEYPKSLLSGEDATIWLVGHDASGKLYCDSDPNSLNSCYAERYLDICWGKNITSSNKQPSQEEGYPAIEVFVIYEDSLGEIQSTVSGFDANNARRSVNLFYNVDSSKKNGVKNPFNCTNPDSLNEYTIYARLDFADMGITNYATPGAVKLVTIRMLYNSEPHPLEIITDGSLPLPSQGRRIDSTGTAGVATRRVEVSLLYADAPVPFTSAMASKGDIVK